MTVRAKAIIALYFGNAAKLSYFSGCSTGGRQALMEAQRFDRSPGGCGPEDL
jgi:feruloyl esterase